MMLVMTGSEQARYIVAVSGGIDSVVLLDKLSRDGKQLIVAHVDHGVRPDSAEDLRFVSSLAVQYGHQFVSTSLSLGTGASEDTARQARYEWLEAQRAKFAADAIVTAHHEDDVLETICINLTRSTGWRGLCSLRETAHVRRPLLGISKAEIITYALEHALEWHEDSTNDSMQYLRNRIRHVVIPKLTKEQRHRLLELYQNQLALRYKIEIEARDLVQLFSNKDGISRYSLIMLDETLGAELLRDWLGLSLERPRLRDLLWFAKVAKPGAKWSLDSKRFVAASQRRLIVLPPRD